MRSISTATAHALRHEIAPLASYTVEQGPVNCAFQSLAYTQACRNHRDPDFMRSVMDAVGWASTASLDDAVTERRNRAMEILRANVKHLKWGVPTIDEVDFAVEHYGGARLKGRGLTTEGTRFADSSFHCIVIKRVLVIEGTQFFLLYDPEGKPNVSEWEKLLAGAGPKSLDDFDDADYIAADRVKDLYRLERAEDVLRRFAPRTGVTDWFAGVLTGDRDGMSAVTEPYGAADKV